MRSVPLSDNLADKSVQGGARGEEAAIHAEIAERVLELRELVGPMRTVGFFEKTLAIFKCKPAGPAAYWALMHLLTGDLSEITRSYTEQGKEGARSKQAVQQEMERIIITIRPHFAELAAVIVQLRSVSAQLQDEHSVKKPDASVG